MKIGINTLFLVPGDVGGTEVYLRENLKEMIPTNPQDTFVLFTSRDNEERFREDLAGCRNVEFVQLPFRSAIRPLRIIVEQTLLPWQVRKHRIDVLWSPGYTAPLRCACPQVVTIHDMQYKIHPDDVSFLERVTLDFLVKNACRRCDAIIAVSQFSKREIVRFNFAADQQVDVIHEGVDPAFAETSAAGLSGLIDLPAGTPFILCVAHTYPHKQVHVLIEAFGELIDELPHHLVLVGKPRRGETKVEQSLATLPNLHRIHRISDLTYTELKCLYQKADIFVLPSEYEGFGLPILEALLAGVPTITMPKASLPEVGGDHVKYVKQNNAKSLAEMIREVYEMPQGTRQEWVQSGREWAQTFSWEKSAAETLQVLKRIASV